MVRVNSESARQNENKKDDSTMEQRAWAANSGIPAGSRFVAAMDADGPPVCLPRRAQHFCPSFSSAIPMVFTTDVMAAAEPGGTMIQSSDSDRQLDVLGYGVLLKWSMVL